jgi:hypothetical protein
MPFSLVLSNPGAETTKAIADDVILADVPADYKVYIFYYPGAMPDAAVEKQLRTLGEQSGDNLYVLIGRLNDPQYAKFVNLFDIKSLPVVIVTANADLASIPEDDNSAFIRLDGRQLLRTPDQLIDCLQTIVNFMLQGKIEEASRQPGTSQRRMVASRIFDSLKGLVRYVSETDIAVALFGGKLELKRHD